MPGFEDLTRTLPAIETTLYYVDPAAPIGSINDVEREKSTFTLLPYQVAIRDMRPIQKSLSLDTTGFVLLERPTRVTDFYNSAQVENIYMPEIVALIAELTGADRVLTFGTLIRNNAPNAPAIAHKSVHNAHIDYNLATTRAVVDRLLPEAEKPRYAGGRVMQMNVWRPIATIGKRAAGVVRFPQYRPGGPDPRSDRRQEPGRAGRRRLEPGAQSGASLVLRAAHEAERGAGIPPVRFRRKRTAMGGAHLVQGPDQRARRRPAPKHRSAHAGVVSQLTA